MKRILNIVIVSCICTNAFSQDATLTRQHIRLPEFGISFFYNDFETARKIRSTSLSTVLRKGDHATFNQMDAGVAVSFFKGLTKHVDLSMSLAGSTADYFVSEQAMSGNLLLEADASLNLKLLTEQFWFTPYATIGAGASKYGGYFGAFVPMGLGLQINILDQAHFFVSSQYRVPVTTSTSNYHFMHAIGIAGMLGRKD
ncbi:MAG TPA: hypothetical protein VEZ55_16780 [Chitinophagaceae bacterium]|nr:hypothetical protein [Chitinophagaceae bacterium]